MTTIIATRTAIYADSQCTAAHEFKTNKLHHVTHEGSGEEYLVGGCGFLHELEFFVRLLREYGLDTLWKLHLGEHWPPKLMKNFDTDVLIVTRERKVYLVEARNMVPVLVNQEEYCMGSGGDWARAHRDLVTDGTPEQAIEYAATRDPYTKGPVNKITFKRRSK